MNSFSKRLNSEIETDLRRTLRTTGVRFLIMIYPGFSKIYFVAVEEAKSELVVSMKFQVNIIGVINSEAEKNNYYSEIIVKKLCNIPDYLSIALNRLGYVSNMSAGKIPYIHIEF